jgi:hypothetical protein
MSWKKGKNNPNWKGKLLKGKKQSLKHKRKNSISHKGDKNPMKRKDVKEKQSETRKRLFKEGKLKPNRYWKGKKHTEEYKKKMSLSLSGEKNPMWKGGLSKEEYTINWTNTLKLSILERDKYKCKICKKHQEELNEKLCVHHIDYNKKNCNPDNLITLCRSCHTKTNTNRNKWIEFFKELSK